jgi:hypothetical protein
MSKVKVTFDFEPEPDEVDDGHEMGVTNECFERLMDDALGAEDSHVERHRTCPAVST